MHLNPGIVGTIRIRESQTRTQYLARPSPVNRNPRHKRIRKIILDRRLPRVGLSFVLSRRIHARASSHSLYESALRVDSSRRI